MNKMIPILALLILPLSVQAVAVGSDGSASVQTGKTSTEVRSDISVDAKSSDNEKEGTSVDSDLDAIESLTDKLEIESDATTTTRIANAMEVNDDTELGTFKDSIRSANKNVESVDTESGDGIVVEYTHGARLFGFIPVRITSKTVVRANVDGSPIAETTFPWWKIFLTGVGETSDKVDSSITASASAKAYVSDKASARAKAILTETVIATLNADEGVSLLGQ